MRVLHVEVGGSYGGTVRWLEVYLAHSDRSFVHDILFYYPTPGTERLKPLVRKLWTLYDGLPSWLAKPAPTEPRRLRVALKSSPLGGPLRALQEWIDLARQWPKVRDIRRILRAGDYDVVHANNTFTYQAPTLLAARLAGVPVVAHMANPVAVSAYARMLARLTNCVVTVNQGFETELKSWGLPVDVRTCYNGVELPEVQESCSSQLRASLLSEGTVLIGSVGRLDRQKGYEDLIQAARQVTEAHPEVRFAIAGGGPLRPTLEKLIADLNLQGKFQLCGFRQDVGDFLGALDLFVCSSHWEGLPLAVVEAMLMGKPVVATNVGGNSEVVVPERTGMLVPPGKPEALAAAVLLTLDNKDEALRQAKEARQLAVSMFDPRSCAQRVDEILRSAIVNRRLHEHSAPHMNAP